VGGGARPGGELAVGLRAGEVQAEPLGHEEERRDKPGQEEQGGGEGETTNLLTNQILTFSSAYIA
jgi:hypothetical protein